MHVFIKLNPEEINIGRALLYNPYIVINANPKKFIYKKKGDMSLLDFVLITLYI